MSCYNNAKYRWVYMYVLQIALIYLLIAEIIEMAQPAPLSPTGTVFPMTYVPYHFLFSFKCGYTT